MDITRDDHLEREIAKERREMPQADLLSSEAEEE